MQEEKFFFGEYSHALDSQNRVAIPREWRQRSCDTRLILFPGGGNDLLLFPFESFQDFMVQARKKSFTNRKIRDVLALVGARSSECICDKQGRIKLPAKHLEDSGITGQVTLVGAFTYIKLCSPESWKKIQNESGSCLDELEEISDDKNNDLVQLLHSLMDK
jgi:transcriptional regulator MraZ